MNLKSERGIIQPPNLDDRTWQDLVDEMTALIPRYAPQWTDRSPSDLGMTLIELFAWLVEQLIYRLNRVPEKNYVAFLKLLGIPRDPPAPARTFLTFTAPQTGKDGGTVVTVDKGTQAQTLGSEREAPVVFETDEDVTVLPINLTEVLVFDGERTVSIREQFGLPPGKGYELAVAKGKRTFICLGFDRASTESLKLRMMFSKPLKSEPSPDPQQPPIEAKITWLYSTGVESKPSSWTQIFPAEAVLSSELRLQRDGVIELALPAKDNEKPWTQSDASQWISPAGTEKRPGFWIGIQIDNQDKASEDLGIHFILFNSVSAHNALSVDEKEKLPLKTVDGLSEAEGNDYEVFLLPHRPLFQQLDSADPYAHLKVVVARVTNGQETETIWTRVPDLLTNLRGSSEEQKHFYVADPVTGEIRFGGGDRATKLTKGNKVKASYRYLAGGVSGNVGPNRVVMVSKLSSEPSDAVVTVTNPLAATGGRDEEPIDEALRRAPGLLKTRYRAITAEDYEYLVREAAPEVHIVRCLDALKPEEPKKTWAGLDRSPGMVNLIIVPVASPEVKRPTPTPDLIRRVQGYLDQRRDLTANLVVTTPRYLPVTVRATLKVWKRAKDRGIETAKVGEDTMGRIDTFLHPIYGGPNGEGWQVGEHVLVADLFKAIMPSTDVGYIESVEVVWEMPDFTPNQRTGTPTYGATVRVFDYELVCSAKKHDVTVSYE